MKSRGNILIGIALTGAIVLVLAGCSKQGEFIPTADTMPHVRFEASVSSTSSSQAPKSRLTQSSSDALGAGVFEVQDKVGLFLYDQNSASYSFTNELYTADENVKFVPSQEVYYKSYYLHNIYAYFPHSITSANAAAIPVSIKADQTNPVDYMACDFLSTHLKDIKPQQINPNAAELSMKFNHQMTSLVVTIKNADGSPIRPIPAISVVNTKTTATLDITQATPSITLEGTIDPVLRNAIRMRQNDSKTVVNGANETLFYEAIVMPQAITVGKPLIFIQIGTGKTARTFEYKPASGDPILTAGLAQGMEHIFELTLSGTDLNTQGGEIVDWGTGTALSQTISGGGIVTSKMRFELTGEPSSVAALGAKVQSASINIDGTQYNAEVSFDGTSTLTLSYKVPDWQFDMEYIKLLDAEGNSAITIPAFDKIRITGNPTDAAYTKVIASIDAQSGVVSKK